MTQPAPALRPTVEISWDGSGSFDGPFDDVTGYVAGDPGVAVTLGKDGSRTLDPPQVSSFDFELLNHTGRFSPERADSPIQQQIAPGRPVRLRATIGEADVYRGTDAYRASDYYRGTATYDVAHGAIDDMSIDIAWGNERARYRCLGYEQVLVPGTVTIGLMTAPRVDQCVTAILDAVGWPTGKRAVSVADTTLTYWWADEKQPWAALVELLLAEGPGAMYADAEGVFHFENRNYRTTAGRSTAPQATFFDLGLHETGALYREAGAYRDHDYYRGQASGLWFTTMTYDPGFAAIRNRATYAYNVRRVAPLGKVWEYGAPFALNPGETRTLFVKPDTPFQNPVTPVLGTDYTRSPGGSSVSVAFRWVVQGLVGALDVAHTGGPAATVSGPTGAEPNGIMVRAEAILSLIGQPAENSVDASASIARYSPIPGASIPRVFEVNGWPEISEAAAIGTCDAWVRRYMNVRPSVTLTVVGGDGSHMRQIVERKVSDRITLVEGKSGLQGDAWINGRTLTISALGGTRVVAEWRCEKCDDVLGGIWDISLWDDGVGIPGRPPAIWGF